MILKKNELTPALQSALKWTQTKGKIPAYAAVSLSFSEEELRIATTDGNRYFRTTVVGTGGAVQQATVEAKSFVPVVSSLTGETVSLTVGDSFLTVKSESTVVRLLLGASESFPEFPECGRYTDAGKGEAWSYLFRQTCIVTQPGEDDSLRTSIRVWSDKTKLCAVATDGRRLHVAEYDIGTELNLEPIHLQATDARKLQGLLAEEPAVLLGRCDATPGMVWFRFGASELGIATVELQFPDFRQVIPERGTAKITVDIERDPLVAALRLVSLVANPLTLGVRLVVEPGRVQVEARGQSGGEGETSLPAKTSGTIAVHLSASFVLDALACHEGMVRIGLEDETRPVRIDGEDRRTVCVVMPMRM